MFFTLWPSKSSGAIAPVAPVLTRALSATIQIWYENLSIELDKIHFFLYETWWQKRKLDDDGY